MTLSTPLIPLVIIFSIGLTACGYKDDLTLTPKQPTQATVQAPVSQGLKGEPQGK